VQVAVRIRPPLPREIGGKGEFRACLGVDGHDLYVTTEDAPIVVHANSKLKIGDKSGPLRRFRFPGVYESVSPPSLLSANGVTACTLAWGAPPRRATLGTMPALPRPHRP
jgi:hypothetical protein